MAAYNQWMNEKIYAAAAKLPMGQFEAERGAFFGSLAGTLNHLLLGDTIWLQRFAAHPVRFDSLDAVRALPKPTGLAPDLTPPLERLLEQRQMLDAAITSWVGELRGEHLDQTLHYSRLNGERYAKRFGSVLAHFFNHQTHHRGQASTLLFQAGLDIGSTDLLVLIPEAVR
ncbi:MAG: DinB family protein [Bdellovibrionales bacterium]|nr:DinB family protein [Massilia sp.]